MATTRNTPYKKLARALELGTLEQMTKAQIYDYNKSLNYKEGEGLDYNKTYYQWTPNNGEEVDTIISEDLKIVLWFVTQTPIMENPNY